MKIKMTTIRATKGKYECRCMVRYQYQMIGLFNTKQEAILAYNQYIQSNHLNRKLMTVGK